MLEQSIIFTEYQISDDYIGFRLDYVLSKIIEEIPSRTFAEKLIENKQILINNKHIKSSYKVKLNDIIKINLSFLDNHTEELIPEYISLDILFEDNDILVLNKPAGIVVHPGAGNKTGTLLNGVLYHCKHELPVNQNYKTRAGVVHRLDKDTSGVIIFAKTHLALIRLAEQFAKHSQGRKYYALVQGIMNKTDDKIETWHGRDLKHRIKYAVQKENIGKKAIMYYKVIQNFADIASLIECHLYTGRTHQIRVQMSNLGHPLLGDLLYGWNATAFYKKIINKENIKIKRQMLHAYSLSLKHPTSGVNMEWLAPKPFDLEEIMSCLKIIK